MFYSKKKLNIETRFDVGDWEGGCKYFYVYLLII